MESIGPFLFYLFGLLRRSGRGFPHRLAHLCAKRFRFKLFRRSRHPGPSWPSYEGPRRSGFALLAAANRKLLEATVKLNTDEMLLPPTDALGAFV